MNATSVKFISNVVRRFSTKPTTNGNIQPFVYNRNPRNLERLRLERKPSGYSLEVKNVEFWHKLELLNRDKYILARLVHNTDKVVVQASTDEWAIRKHLYSAKDKQAHIILAKVFAERCMESGLLTFACDLEQTDEDNNAQTFLRILTAEGLMIGEPPVFNVYDVWQKNREKKPWTVLED